MCYDSRNTNINVIYHIVPLRISIICLSFTCAGLVNNSFQFDLSVIAVGKCKQQSLSGFTAEKNISEHTLSNSKCDVEAIILLSIHAAL